MCNTIRSSNGARQRVAGGVGVGGAVMYHYRHCSTVQTAAAGAFTVCFFLCVRACGSRLNQTEMVSSPGEKPCASSSPTTIAAIHGTEQSEEISLGLFWESIRSRILVFVVLFFFPLPAGGTCGWLFAQPQQACRSVELVHSSGSYAVHRSTPPPPPPSPDASNENPTLQADVSAPEAPDVTFYTWQQ